MLDYTLLVIDMRFIGWAKAVALFVEFAMHTCVQGNNGMTTDCVIFRLLIKKVCFVPVR